MTYTALYPRSDLWDSYRTYRLVRRLPKKKTPYNTTKSDPRTMRARAGAAARANLLRKKRAAGNPKKISYTNLPNNMKRLISSMVTNPNNRRSLGSVNTVHRNAFLRGLTPQERNARQILTELLNKQKRGDRFPFAIRRI